MNVLAIDIGNTRTTIGLFRGRKLAGTAHMPSASSPVNNIRLQLLRLLRQSGVSRHGLSGAVISSVVPSLTKRLSVVVEELLHVKALVVRGDSKGLVHILHQMPRRLGSDRICNAVAAFDKYGGPVIVVDLGTAITYDVVTKDGKFLGGAIAPGIRTAAIALHQQTAQLPEIELRFPRHVIGKNTVESIQSGIFFGVVDAVEGMVRRIRALTGKQTKVVLTGGFSDLIYKRSGVFHAVEPSLVLEGARIFFERSRPMPG